MPPHGFKKEEPIQLYDLSDGASAADKELLVDVKGLDMRVAPRAHSGFKVMVFYNLMAALSFVFLLVAICPVHLYKAHNGEKWTIWKGPGGKKWTDSECDHEKEFFTAIQAFAVVGFVFSILNLLAGVLQMMGKGHMGLTLLMGLVACGTSLTTWALMVHAFHRYNCYLQPVLVHTSKLGASFALTITAFGLLFFGLVALGYYFYEFFAMAEYHREDFSYGAVGATVFTAIALIISSVGATQPLWENWGRFDEKDINSWYWNKYGLWHTEQYLNYFQLPVVGPNKIEGCSKASGLLKVGQAFCIICPILIFGAYLTSLASVYKSGMKMIAMVLCGVSSVTLLILWATQLAFRYVKCNGVTVFEGFTMTEAMGMFLGAFFSMLLALVMLITKK